MKFKTWGKLPITLMEFRAYALKIIKKKPKDVSMYMVGLGKHADLDRICPKNSPDIGVVHLVRMVEIVIMDSS